MLILYFLVEIEINIRLELVLWKSNRCVVIVEIYFQL